MAALDMRIATWNVNSLAARIDKVWWWLERAQPDVLLLQETKLADADAPADAFRARGYELAHHGQGRWNGVAIASRVGVRDVVVNFGDPLAKAPDTEDVVEPFAEARMIAATCGGVRVASVYVPNGRALDSPFYAAKLVWLERLARWVKDERAIASELVVGGDFNVAPSDLDVWDAAACHGATHVSERERAAIAALVDLGLADVYRAQHAAGGRYSWWDYRAGHFHKNYGMRIDLLLASPSVAARTIATEIDREARKGKPTPSDHTPVVMDLDTPGVSFDAGWAGAEKRIAARNK